MKDIKKTSEKINPMIAGNNFQDAVGHEIDSAKAIQRSLYYSAHSHDCPEPWNSMLEILTMQTINRLKKIETLVEDYVLQQRAGK